MGLCFSSVNVVSECSCTPMPFILIARCHVKPDTDIDIYLEAARIADKKVMASEPGMLHHTFDQDPDDPLCFVWSEVYIGEDALIYHLANPALAEFFSVHEEMGDDFSVEIYGVLSAETQEMCSSLAFPVKHYVSHLGYSRLSGIQTSL